MNKENFYKPREVATIDGKETSIIYVPLFIPKVIMDNGADVSFAVKKAGWTPTIEVTQKNEDGSDKLDENQMVMMETIPNPISAERAGINYIQDIVRSIYLDIMMDQGAEQVRNQAQSQFDQLFN